MTDLDTALERLERIADLADEAGLHTVSGELRDERIPALREGRLHVVVLGEFNHGKSTLINALLGEDVLPMGITPTTAVITKLVAGEGDHVTVTYTDDTSEDVAHDRIEELVREENDRVRHLVVRHHSAILDDKVILVDTPGVNDISQQKVEVTYGIVPRADLVVMVLDATQVLKRTEIRFIEKRLLTGMRDRLLFVLGKMDRLDANEVVEVEQYARERLEAMLGRVELFPLSARRARQDRDEGFERFRDHFSTFLRRRRDIILLDSALGAGSRGAGALLGNLRIKRRGYLLAREELNLRVDAVRGKLSESRMLLGENVNTIDESVRNLTATARHNIGEFRDAFLDALPREIEKASASDVQRYLPGFIEECFRDFLEQEGQSLGKALEQLAEHVIAITNENLREAADALQEELGLDPSSIDVTVDSTAYDFSVFAMGAFGVSVLVFINALVGGLIALATPLVAYVLKERLDAQVKTKASKAGEDAIRAVATRAEDELVAMIRDFGERLRQFVEDAGDRLYRQIDEALQAVVVEREAVGGNAALLDEKAADTESSVVRELSELTEERQKLWAAALH